MLNPGESVSPDDLPQPQAHDRLLVVRFDRALVAHELQTLMQRPADADLTFERVVDLRRAPTAGLVPLMRALPRGQS